MEAKEYLKQAVKDLKLKNLNELAQLIGASRSAMDKWVHRNNIPDKWKIIIENMSENVTIGDIKVKVLSAGAGEGVYNFEPRETLITINKKLYNKIRDKNAFAVEIKGDSMSPTLLNGDYAIIAHMTPDEPKEDGIYAIRVEGTIRIKALRFFLDGTIEIFSHNKLYGSEIYNPEESQIDFEIIGKKVAHLSFR